MLTVFQYGDIRRAHRDGMNNRYIARTFHHSLRKIRQNLAEGQPWAFTRRPAPVVWKFQGVNDRFLADDEQAPPKQPHPAMQVYRRLRDEQGYRGGYDQKIPCYLFSRFGNVTLCIRGIGRGG